MTNVFVYGTLIAKRVLLGLLKATGGKKKIPQRVAAARLESFAGPFWVQDAPYPGIREGEATDFVAGLLLLDLTEEQVATLDWFEEAPLEYERRRVMCKIMSEPYAFLADEWEQELKSAPQLEEIEADVYVKRGDGSLDETRALWRFDVDFAAKTDVFEAYIANVLEE